MGNMDALIALIGCEDEYKLINTSVAIHFPKLANGLCSDRGKLVTDIPGLNIDANIIHGYTIEDYELNELGAMLVVKSDSYNDFGIKIITNYDYIAIINGIPYCRLLSSLKNKGCKATNMYVSASGINVFSVNLQGKRYVMHNNKIQELR